MAPRCHFRSDVIFPGFSNLPVNGKLPVNCHNLPVNYQEFLKQAVDHVKLGQNIQFSTFFGHFCMKHPTWMAWDATQA